MALYIQMLQGEWTRFTAADGRQMLGCGKARLLARYLQQTRVVTEMMYEQQTFGFQIAVQTFKGCSESCGELHSSCFGPVTD